MQTLAPNVQSGQPSSNDPLLQRKYRNLIRQHFDKIFDKLFAEFTGLHFHIAWTPSRPQERAVHFLPSDRSACCRLLGSAQAKDCRICGPRRLARMVNSAGEGHRFTCRLGVRNYWLPIKVRDQTLGIAYLQALDPSCASTFPRKRSACATRQLLRQIAKILSPEEFARAARLLHLIIQHVETCSLSDLRKSELTNAGRAVLALEKEQARLQETLQRHLPHTPQTLRSSGPESHPEQIVRRLLERIEHNYSESITLRRCARELGMNAAYASALFSRTVGIPFKTYLTELRMEKARGLLSNPAMTVSDVGAAVGYTSENRFRIAFKKLTGLCPKLWRETMQANPSLRRPD